MPKGDIAIVFDCGATVIRASALDSYGTVLATASQSNNTIPDPFYPEYRAWDFFEIWQKLCKASLEVTSQIDIKRIAGVTVTTFGVDGTFFDKNGKMLYPVISWQCDRTKAIMESIEKYMPLENLYTTSGVLPFSFNTINKLVWFKENKPEIIDKASTFLYTPSIIRFFLSGEMVNDITMAGTSMTTSLSERAYSKEIYCALGLPEKIMGKTVEPGTITGKVSASASALTGLPKGLPVIATGHDTQFALFGSGAPINVPVLSSGTWEILMVRSRTYNCGKYQLASGISTELDVKQGLYNIGSQWLASGALEWIRKSFYPDIKENIYDIMISGAEKVPQGSKGIKVKTAFNESQGAEITGLSMDSTRDQIYRATLEALSERLRQGKEALENAGGFRTSKIICVGGGTLNHLWNQLRADATGAVIRVIDKTETTVLGASMFVQYATGNASSPEEAAEKVKYNYTEYHPNEK